MNRFYCFLIIVVSTIWVRAQNSINGVILDEQTHETLIGANIILLNSDDTIAEGSGQNIFIIKDGVFHTNDAKSNILMGITRHTLFTLIEDLGYKHKTDVITQEDLFNADEVFYCGSASEVTPIRQIDNHVIGSGKAGEHSLKIQNLYYEIVRGNHKKYFKWLTFANNH